MSYQPKTCRLKSELLNVQVEMDEDVLNMLTGSPEAAATGAVELYVKQDFFYVLIICEDVHFQPQ